MIFDSFHGYSRSYDVPYRIFFKVRAEEEEAVEHHAHRVTAQPDCCIPVDETDVKSVANERGRGQAPKYYVTPLYEGHLTSIFINFLGCTGVSRDST